MSDLVFEPFAVRQLWRLPEPVSGHVWRELLAGYAASLASAITAAAGGRPVVIGHIKLLATFAGEGYLRISAVDAAHAPTCDGNAPDGLAEISTTANVLVYGLERVELERLAWESALAAAAPWQGQVVECKDERGDRSAARGFHHHGVDAD